MRSARHLELPPTITSLCVLVLLLAFATSIAAEEQQRSRVEISVVSISLGFGYSWGTGSLYVGSDSYRFTVENVKVGAVGVSHARASGTVRNLDTKRLDEFSGTYAGGEAGLVVGGGGGLLRMVNQHGVVIELQSVQTGFAAIFGPGGMTLELTD